MNTIDWLLDSDPAIRWQAMRDLTDASPAAIAAARARVAQQGLGAAILARQEVGRLVAPDRRPGLVADPLHVASPARDRR